jgi:hypothetical protein
METPSTRLESIGVISGPISDADRDRFLREIVANSGPNGISAAALDDALDRFIRMQIDAAAITMWNKGDLRFGWQNGDMIWSLTAKGRA